jgi:hypothetical protein
MKKIVVLSGGISGYGSAILAKKKGFDVFLSDKGRIADRYKAKLDQWQVPYEEGHHSEERILAADEVVKSPGIPDKAPMIVKLREAGIPVISEMEFAGRYLGKARTICVTDIASKSRNTLISTPSPWRNTRLRSMAYLSLLLLDLKIDGHQHHAGHRLAAASRRGKAPALDRRQRRPIQPAVAAAAADLD